MGGTHGHVKRRFRLCRQTVPAMSPDRRRQRRTVEGLQMYLLIVEETGRQYGGLFPETIDVEETGQQYGGLAGPALSLRTMQFSSAETGEAPQRPRGLAEKTITAGNQPAEQLSETRTIREMGRIFLEYTPLLTTRGLHSSLDPFPSLDTVMSRARQPTGVLIRVECAETYEQTPRQIHFQPRQDKFQTSGLRNFCPKFQQYSYMKNPTDTIQSRKRCTQQKRTSTQQPRNINHKEEHPHIPNANIPLLHDPLAPLSLALLFA